MSKQITGESTINDLIKSLPNLPENSITLQDIIDTVNSFKKYPPIIEELLSNGLVQQSDIKVINTYLININRNAAAYLLKYSNPRNRKLSSKNLNKIIQSILDGDFIETGETIKFAELDNQLVDGHTRLTAASMADTDIPVPLELRFGLSEEAIYLIDKGLMRKNTDTVHMLGSDHAMIMTPVYSNIYVWNTYKRYGTLSSVNAETQRIPNSLTFERMHNLYGDAEAFIAPQNGISTQQILTFISWLLHEVDYDDAEIFMEKLNSGVNLTHGDPVLALRTKLIEWKKVNDTKGKKGSHSTRKIMSLICKAWNYSRKGKKIQTISIGPKEYATKCIIPK